MRELLYREVADSLATLIDSGAFKSGSRVPSIRELSAERRVSANTVREAYSLLETQGYLECRPQSGYFVSPVRADERQRAQKKLEDFETDPRSASMCRIFQEVTLRQEQLTSEWRSGRESNSRDDVVRRWGPSLAISSPSPSLLPMAKLASCMSRAVQEEPGLCVDYSLGSGQLPLREEIAKRMLSAGVSVSPEEILVTSGASEAIFLSLLSIVKEGDVVAVESPLYFNFLSFFQRFNLRLLEIPADSWRGVQLEVLEYALKRNSVKAFVSNPTWNNPSGFSMAEERRAALVELLEKHGVPLIEDDVYGELGYGASRPRALKSFDRTGNVVYCSSFSKSLAPGYRIGWTIPGKLLHRLDSLKSLATVSSPSPTQAALARYLSSGAYPRHLRSLTKTLSLQMASLRAAVSSSFPAGTVMTDPQGGCILWVTLPPSLSSMELYTKALERGILFSPGDIFSNEGGFRNCLRLISGTWNEGVEAAVKELGELACRMEGTGL